MIDPVRFAAFAPNALPGTCDALRAAATQYGITQPLALAHWLGQMSVESAGFKVMAESLNYSNTGLIATFGTKRISQADADQFGRTSAHPANQNAIANIVYGGAFGLKNLGNNQPGDGWRFRGGGFKQITGRSNYAQAGHEDDPDTLRTDVQASSNAAANFFVKHGCVAPALRDDVKAVTKLVNGGYNGLGARIAATAAAKKVVGLA